MTLATETAASKPSPGALQLPRNLIKDCVYVRADRDKKAKRPLGNTGIELIIDTKFRPTEKENCCHDGTVVVVPAKLSSKKPVEIKDGDHVYGSHFLTSEEYEDDNFGQRLYLCSYEETLYCKILDDGKIQMLSDWNFLEPILEPEENLYSPSGLQVKPHREKVPLRGIARHLSKTAKAMGIREGDVVIFTQDSDYEIDVEGVTYYRMRDQFMVAIEQKK